MGREHQGENNEGAKSHSTTTSNLLNLTISDKPVSPECVLQALPKGRDGLRRGSLGTVVLSDEETLPYMSTEDAGPLSSMEYTE
ncbi:hypothetical protein BGZ80_011084, partial [Entomortierella chlamydospora]